MNLEPSTQPIPVYLITGLLGSGKTTALLELIQQKPANEKWAILVNEFGEIDIDSAALEQAASFADNATISVTSVSGGCICCTANLSLGKAINRLLETQKIDRLFIEPTGLGHPAQIMDVIAKSSFLKPLQLNRTICIITAQQLTPSRWEKSQVMRDLVHLADTVVLNKTDLATTEQQQIAQKLLQQCYPPKSDIICTEYGKIDLQSVLNSNQHLGFKILPSSSLKMSASTSPLKQNSTSFNKTQIQQATESNLTSVEQCFISFNPDHQEVLGSAGWVWTNQVQFNRIKLKQMFQTLSSQLLRAKGVLKTGNEWQLFQWSDGEIEFSDIAWRQDSRLECIFKPQANETITLAYIESQIEQTIHTA